MNGVFTTRKGLIEVVAMMGTTSGEYRASFLFSWPRYVKNARHKAPTIKTATSSRD
eukprot:CAMPEP_0185443140 /NCGR_PEP_ID=MMETSP1365-20130426/46522_1 /TAXON_ID=38817 /ORGANISM="Gephyrocapsa oceanica, Strain RCC1303" /LENGTH=55 /DNA_ID=CAMNT_0028048731 /DNA_START=565 /DNA_END=732 /DNA_ORIENTATION=+